MWTRDVALSPLPHYLHQAPSRSILIYPRQSSRPKQAQPRFVNGSQALGNPNIACKMPGTGKLVAAGPQLNIDFSLLWESDHPQQHSPQTCGPPPPPALFSDSVPQNLSYSRATRGSQVGTAEPFIRDPLCCVWVIQTAI
ncbi:hypothetical protein L207DRAFT_264880 [Hyaloscypha variabilis F]|uniref:Uncharacterized protein n=1 Tax=Hyaloscypha variabilis (strain UAMH 11265 / GT02V1 / F) TaxID=1149755 RepID=A0A2J6QRJ6_HYAVF|nr:hypothetical protein L207DRAFT_264880 [Hyaloscypha variabilis F]